MKLLMVYPYAFAYGWAGETPRMLHVSRGLRRLGWELDLLRCKQPKESQLKPVKDAFPGRVITAQFNGIYPAFFNRRGLRRVFDLCRRSAVRDSDNDSTELVANRLLRLARNAAIPKPDIIWGITVGHLVGPVSAQVLSAHFHCPYVVEFRDPIPHPGTAPLGPRSRSLLASCLSRSALVITTTEGISRKVEEDFPVVRDKVRTIYSCYDDEVPPQADGGSERGRMVLLHAGVLYGGKKRNARNLVKGIAEAVKLDESLRDRIRLQLIGAGAGGLEAAALASELGIPRGVELLPQMAPQACLLQMDRADVLVAIKFDDADYDLQIPGKVFQYLGRAKPILGVMRETEAAAILRRSGLGIVVANADVAGIAAALLEFWKHRESLAQRFKPDWDYIRQFSAEAMARSIDRELAAVLCDNGSNSRPNSMSIPSVQHP